MGHLGSLVEPLFLLITSEKAKERHDALAKLKAILDDSKNLLNLAPEQCIRCLQSFNRMIRHELKPFLYDEREAESKTLTTLQTNKISQVLKDYRWILGLLDASYPSVNILACVPDIYNICLDCLQSSLTVVHSDILFIVRSFILIRKPYLMILSEEQWSSFMDIFSVFLFECELSSVMESDIIACVFFLSLHIPNQPDVWSLKASSILELIKQILSLTLTKGHETPSLALLFRTTNYLLCELKIRDRCSYDVQKIQLEVLVKRFNGFKTTLILEEFYLLFIQNQIEGCPVLNSLANNELARSKLRPSDIDPFTFGDACLAYVQRRRNFSYPKGYLPFLVGAEFCCQYASRETFTNITISCNIDMFAYILFYCHFDQGSFLNFQHVLSLLESSSGPKKSWFCAIFIAYLKNTDLANMDQQKQVLDLALSMCSKPGTAGCGAQLLSYVLMEKQELIHHCPPFAQLLEYLSCNTMSSTTLKTIAAALGAHCRGIWWSTNALKAYESVCQFLIKSVDHFRDGRSWLEFFIQNSFIIAELLSIPFRKRNYEIDVPQSFDSEFLSRLPVLNIMTKKNVIQHFEGPSESSLLGSFNAIFESFLEQLKESILIVGFSTAKIVAGALPFDGIKEENFGIFCIQQLLLFNILLMDSNPNESLLQWNFVPINMNSQLLNSFCQFIDGCHLEKSILLLKFLIQCFEKFKSLPNPSKDSLPGVWHLRPIHFLESHSERNDQIAQSFLELFLKIRNQVMKREFADEESLLFVEDFNLYLAGNLVHFAQQSSPFLCLLSQTPKLLPFEKCVEILSLEVYRNDELAISTLIMILIEETKTHKKSSKLKEFIDPIYRRYLKWGFSTSTKAKALELFTHCLSHSLLKDDDMMKVFRDPCHFSIDMIPKSYLNIALKMNSVSVNYLYFALISSRTLLLIFCRRMALFGKLLRLLDRLSPM